MSSDLLPNSTGAEQWGGRPPVLSWASTDATGGSMFGFASLAIVSLAQPL
jgi:hypothetical protein